MQALVLGHLRIEGSNAETMDLKRLAILERNDAGARLGSSTRGIDAGKTSAHNHNVCLVGVGELRWLLGLDAPRRELVHPGRVVLNLLVGCSGRLRSGSIADLSLVGQGSRGHSACSENTGRSAGPLKKRPAVKMRNLCHENSPFLVTCAHSTPSAPYARATPPAPGLTTPLKHPAPIARKQQFRSETQRGVAGVWVLRCARTSSLICGFSLEMGGPGFVIPASRFSSVAKIRGFASVVLALQ